MNPVQRFQECFPTMTAAAKAAGITREMLRLHRNRGYVTTRALALRMELACGKAVSAAQLLAVDRRQGRQAAA